MKNQHTSHDELRKLAPELAKHPRENAYRVPPRYFRELPDRVMARIAEEERRRSGIWIWLTPPQTWFSVLRRPQYALALASVVTVVVATAVLLLPGSDEAFALDLSTDDALAYVMDNIDAYEAGDLMALDPSMSFDDVDLMELQQGELDEALELIMDDMDDTLLEEYF